jgi:hypothetical protein
VPTEGAAVTTAVTDPGSNARPGPSTDVGKKDPVKKRGPGRPRKDGAETGAPGRGSGKKPIVGSLEDENPHALGRYAVPQGR